jgi:hypothetical protein
MDFISLCGISLFDEKPTFGTQSPIPTSNTMQLFPRFDTRLGLTFFLVAGLCSCGQLNLSTWNSGNLRIGSNVTPIRDIKPEQNSQATVYIEGKVERQVPFLKGWAYQINDSTGKIWVVTNQTDLKEGNLAVIKGKVRYKSIPLGGKEFGEVYLEEES